MGSPCRMTPNDRPLRGGSGSWRAIKLGKGRFLAQAQLQGRALPALGPKVSIKIAHPRRTGHRTAMPVARRKSSTPLTFDLPESLIARIARTKKNRQLATASEVVRLALAQFDLNEFKPPQDPHSQISVRIPFNLRATLRRTAKQKDASIGQLVRAALEALPEKASGSAVQRRRRATTT